MREPAYKDNDLVMFNVLYRDWDGCPRQEITELDRVLRITNGGVHLAKNGYFQFDKRFPEWSIRKATDEESLLFKLENPDAFV